MFFRFFDLAFWILIPDMASERRGKPKPFTVYQYKPTLDWKPQNIFPLKCVPVPGSPVHTEDSGLSEHLPV